MSDHDAADVAAFAQELIDERHGYLSWLDTRVDDIEPGTAVLTIPFDGKLTNPTEPPSVHGGVAATLIDTAGGMALQTTLENPFEGGSATINLNVNYLRRADGDLTATAEVIRSGGSVGWADVVVESPDAEGEVRPVAVGQVAYRLFQ
ncbi:MAG: PaaI family thioesterase [Haloarculaceae archaeon]